MMPEASRRRIIGIAVVVIGVFAMAWISYRYWYQPTYEYVEVDDAQVTGNLVRVTAPASGTVDKLFVDVGQAVKANDRVATILVTAGQGSTAGTRVLAQVSSPAGGQIAARRVDVGTYVNMGQTLFTIADLGELWIIADVEEGRIPQITPNQNVDVTIASLGMTLHGQVTGIGAATTEAIDPPAAGLGSSDSTKKIPVRIAVDWGSQQAMPGMTADVIIYLK